MVAKLEKTRASDDVVYQFEPKFISEAFKEATYGPIAMALIGIQE